MLKKSISLSVHLQECRNKSMEDIEMELEIQNIELQLTDMKAKTEKNQIELSNFLLWFQSELEFRT